MAITRRKFVNGTNLIFRIVSNGGYLFKRWDDSSTDNPRTFTVNKNYTQQVLYVETFQLTLASDTTGSVQTFKIDGETISTKEVEKNSTHTVSVIPGVGWAFVKWLDDPTAPQTREVTITEDTTLRVEMVKLHYVDTVVTHTGSGTIAVNGADNVTRFEIRHGDTITVTARPNTTAQWRFEKWEPPYETQPQTFQITVLEDLTISVTYIKQYKVTITDTPTGFGTSTINGLPSPQLIDELDETTLLATPTSSQFAFVNWLKEDGTIASTDNPYVFDIDEDKVLTAHYTYQHLVSLTSSDVALGTVQVDTETAGATCQKYILDGATATITATEVGGKFLRWSDGSTSPVRSFSTINPQTLTAYFSTTDVTITTSYEMEGGATAGHVTIDGVTVATKTVPFGTDVAIEGVSDDVNTTAFKEWIDTTNTWHNLTTLQYGGPSGLNAYWGDNLKEVLIGDWSSIILGSEGGYYIYANVNGVDYTFSQDAEPTATLVLVENTYGKFVKLIYTSSITSLKIVDRTYVVDDAPTPQEPLPTEARTTATSVLLDMFWYPQVLGNNITLKLDDVTGTYPITPPAAGDTYFAVPLTYQPKSVQISESLHSQVNPRTVTLLEDFTTKAVFADPVEITAFTTQATTPPNTNTVTINGSDPDAIVTKKVGLNSQVTLEFQTEQVTVAGAIYDLYSFLNWAKDATILSSNNPYVFSAAASAAGNYEARATRNKVTITVADDLHPLENGTVHINNILTPESRQVDIYRDAELVGTPASGYIFAGWYSADDLLITKENPYVIKPLIDTKIYPKFHEAVTLTLNSNLAREYTSLYIDGELLETSANSKLVDKTTPHTIEAVFEESVTYQFTSWQNEDGSIFSTANPATIEISEDKTLLAHFDQFRYITVRRNIPNPAKLVINGTVRQFAKSYLYPLNEELEVNVIPDESYNFIQWQDLTPEAMPAWSPAVDYLQNSHVRQTSAYGETAYYNAIRLVPLAEEFSSTTSYVDGARVFRTELSVTHYYVANEDIPAGAFDPEKWTEELTPSNKYWESYIDTARNPSRTILLDRAYEFTCNFQMMYKLTVDFDPNRSTALVDGTQLTESHNYKYVYPDTSHKMEIVALEGFAFVEWDDLDTSNPRIVTVSSDAVYVPRMNPPKLFVRMNKSALTGCKAWIGDDQTCTEVIINDPTTDVFIITAEPPRIDPTHFDPTWQFVEWDDHRTDNPREVRNFSGDTYYTAVFSHTSKVTLLQTSNGTIEFPDYPGETTIEVPEGGSYKVLATADSGYEFINWDVDPDDPAYYDNPATFYPEADCTISATFADQLTLTLNFLDTKGSTKTRIYENAYFKYREKKSTESTFSEWRTITRSFVMFSPGSDIELAMDLTPTEDLWIYKWGTSTFAVDEHQTATVTLINLTDNHEVQLDVRPVWSVTWLHDPIGSGRWYEDSAHTVEKIMPPRVFDELEEVLFAGSTDPLTYDLSKYELYADDTPTIKSMEAHGVNVTTGVVDPMDDYHCHINYHRNYLNDVSLSLPSDYRMLVYDSSNATMIAENTLVSTPVQSASIPSSLEYLILNVQRADGAIITTAELTNLLTIIEAKTVVYPKSTSSFIFTNDSVFTAKFTKFIVCNMWGDYTAVSGVKYPDYFIPDFSTTQIKIDGVLYTVGSQTEPTELNMTYGSTIDIELISSPSSSVFSSYTFSEGTFTPDPMTPGKGTFEVPTNNITLSVNFFYLTTVTIRALKDPVTGTALVSTDTTDYLGNRHLIENDDATFSQKINVPLTIETTPTAGILFERFYDHSDETHTFSASNPWTMSPCLDYDINVSAAPEGQIKVIVPCGIKFTYELL